MSMEIPSANNQCSSHEAIQKEQDPGISSEDFFRRAVLSCRTESRMRNTPSITQAKIRAVDSEVTISKDRIDEIVRGILARKTGRLEGRDPLQVRIDQLT